YRDVFNKTEKSFGSSGNCNININCKEGDVWQDVKRSVVLTLTNSNSRLCTGTLVNNTAQDSTPYVLTAEHCGNSASIFVFNYESSNCSPSSDGTLSNSIYGATLRANNFRSDFMLYELNSMPPSSYNVFYAGWSTLSSAAKYATCIHHPSGDVKKISVANGEVLSEVYDGVGSVENHWKVRSWLKGTTEPGSSGAPLFDERQRLVGQLQAGTAACNNPNGYDYYGKFSSSWDANPDSSKSLKHWLDPLNINQLTMDGFDPIAAGLNNDLALLYAYDLDNYYCDSVRFNVLLKNWGNDTIDSFVLKVMKDSQLLDSIKVVKTLLNSETEVVELNAGSFTSGQNDIIVFISEVNGSSDQNTSNDTLNKQLFFNSSPISLQMKIKTDDYGEETTWQISTNKSPSVKLYDGGPYSQIEGGRTYTDTLCLYEGCFTFELYDDWGDGFNGSSNSNGKLLLTGSFNDTLIFENDFRGSSKSYSFCLKDTSTAIIENKAKENTLQLYPNPLRAGEKLYLKENTSSKQLYNLTLLDGTGRQILKYNERSTSLRIPSNLDNGIYFLQIENVNT
ncbi:MAG: trypsin-like peptidase domain-containing protein, partial [Vicingaceae bacterium]